MTAPRFHPQGSIVWETGDDGLPHGVAFIPATVPDRAAMAARIARLLNIDDAAAQAVTGLVADLQALPAATGAPDAA